MNRLNKMQAIKERDLGLSALQEALLHREAGMLDDIKDRTRLAAFTLRSMFRC